MSDIITLAEHRLPLSIDRLSAFDMRAGLFLGFILSLGTAIATFLYAPHASPRPIPLWFHVPRHDSTGLMFFFVAAILAIISLSIRTQWDSPAVHELSNFIDRHHLDEYLVTVNVAILCNNQNAELKARWLQASLTKRPFVAKRPRGENPISRRCRLLS